MSKILGSRPRLLLLLALVVATCNSILATNPFHVDDFRASGYPVRDLGRWQFWVSYNITVSEEKGRAWCYGWNHTDDLTLGDISTTECQEDNSILWSLEKFPHDDAGHDDSDTTSEGQYELAGLNLSVSWQPSDEEGLVAGWHWIPSSDLEWVTVGDEQVQDYQGPESFELNTKDISRD